jgi:hypothetical protein
MATGFAVSCRAALTAHCLTCVSSFTRQLLLLLALPPVDLNQLPTLLFLHRPFCLCQCQYQWNTSSVFNVCFKVDVNEARRLDPVDEASLKSRWSGGHFQAQGWQCYGGLSYRFQASSPRKSWKDSGRGSLRAMPRCLPNQSRLQQKLGVTPSW